jgi:hypothetical protein
MTDNFEFVTELSDIEQWGEFDLVTDECSSITKMNLRYEKFARYRDEDCDAPLALSFYSSVRVDH